MLSRGARQATAHIQPAARQIFQQLLRTKEGQRGVTVRCASSVTHQVAAESPVCSWNEWDPLEEVIVGRIDNACVPPASHCSLSILNADQQEFLKANAGQYYPAEAVAKAQVQVEELVNILQQEGVVVRRPEVVDHAVPFNTPDWQSSGYYAAMPRDILMVIGDEIIEAPMAQRTRFFEYRPYRKLIKEYFNKGAKWTTAPKPTMTDELYNKDLTKNEYLTTEFEPCFDAADFTRAGRDVFGQRSMVTNESGIEWMRRHLAPQGIRVHQVTFGGERPHHIDTTFILLQPGLAIQNPNRKPFDQKDVFTKAGWKIVDSPEQNIKPSHGFYGGSVNLATNFLMLDPKRALVEKEEVGMIKMMDKLGIESVLVPFRDAFKFCGGFHCWTTDVRRRGTLESYF